jgi:putative FmdB family regulatory protein
MPLYEYQCDACGARFELIRKFSDPPLETCPSCQAGPVRKLVSSPAFQFKGSGWYITDYARKNEGGAKAKAKDADAAPAAPAAEPAAKETKAPAADKPAPAAPPASADKK